MSPDLFAALGALAVILIVLALLAAAALVLRARSRDKLQRRVSPEAAAPRDEFALNSEKPLLQTLARRGKAFEKWVDADNESARLLVQAGWRSNESRLMWYVFQAALPVVMVLILLALWFFAPEKYKTLFFIVVALFVGGALSFLIPRWVLRSAAAGRRQRIKNEVPLFIHLLVMLFEAGLSSRQVFASLVREGEGVLPELGGEFELVMRQMEAGGDTGEVLKGLSDVMDVSDLTGVLGVLRQVDRYGGEVRGPLLDMLAVLEERRSLDMREKVNILSGRMTVVMVLFFFPALLVFVAGPAFVSIMKALGNVNGH
ncbi:MAG: type II secretion system F family protein [Stenotrophobium sp.]